MPVPQNSGFGPGNNSLSVPQVAANYLSTPNASRSSAPLPSGSNPRTSFQAPAHKHAHHLHSIPPREKSTRTLILDHMLWVHGRTRFAQARAELGMTDRTGGPSSPNYAHRRRPENYEEEADENSEGEDVVKLKARAGDPHHPPGDEEDDRLHSQDLTLARSLRLRSEGLEKVVNSMLGQPPTFHPMDDEDIWTPPTSPRVNPRNHTNDHPHKLPNGVRVRLALGTIINDLFARQAPPSPYRHQLQVKSPSEQSSDSPFASSSAELPVALASLSTVCAARNVPTSYSPEQSTSSNFSGYSPQAQRDRQSPSPSPRTRSLYNAGADPSTANSPPAFRCPRHLHTGCEICVEAKTGAPGISTTRGRSSSFEYRNGQSNAWKGMPGGVGPGGGGITGWQDGSGIGSGLLRPGVRGSCLRRKVIGLDDVGTSTGSGNTKLSELIPRFIRLSALVAAELATEVKYAHESMRSPGQGPADQYSGNDRDWGQMQHRQDNDDFSPLPPPLSPTTSRAVPQSQDRVYDIALRPTREWYLLLGGLLTRAALEGYLTAGWRGSHAVECLLTVGLDMVESEPFQNVEPSGFEEFDPDGLPSLLEATKLLFPTAQSAPSQRKAQAEEEYEIEMHERLRRFYDIPASTPDLSTHMEDLAWQYPAEPVERAAVRFCEAIAKWRGKPELETYKKPTQTRYAQDTPGTSSLSLDSFVHSNPPTPTMPHTAAPTHPRRPRRKPSIDVYFTQPSPFRGSPWNSNKRNRSPEDTRGTPSKRTNIG